MDAPEQTIAKLYLQNATAPWRRIFEGALVANEFVMNEGSAVLRGEWRSPAAVFCRFGNVAGSPVRFEIADGGALIFTNGSSLYLANSNGAAQVFVRPGARMLYHSAEAQARGLYIGRESGTVAAVVQSGGRVEKNTSMVIGYNGYGVYEMTGGEFYHPYGNGQSRWRIGMNGPGFFYIRNGKYQSGTSGQTSENFEIVRPNTPGVCYGLVFCDGGDVVINHDIRFNRDTANAGEGTYGGLTVAGAGRVTVRAANSVVFGHNQNSRGQAVVNLNGRGILRAGDIYRVSSATLMAETKLNFDGGTFDFRRGTNVFDRGMEAVVYGRGGKIGASSGMIHVTADTNLRLAQGNGVTHLALTGGGSGYMAPPIVTLSGGGGAGATAAAFISYESGMVTGVVITCRGENYLEAPTVSFTGGGGSGAAAVAALGPNGAGALAFIGPNDTAIERLTNFDGEVQACGGNVVISSVATADPGMPEVSAVRVSGGALQVGSGTSAADNALDNLINPAASLFLGGDHGGGTYRQMCGPADNVHSQYFGAIQVNTGKSVLESGGVSVTQGDRSRLALLCTDQFDREAGGVIEAASAHLANFDVKTGASHFFGTAHPILAGVFRGEAAGFLTLSPEGAWTPLELLDEDDFDFDKNYQMTSANLTFTATASAANSLRLADGAQFTFGAAGTTVVGSGMVTVDDGQNGAVINGGAMTSGNGRDLIIYDRHTDNSQRFNRRNVNTPNATLTIGAQIVDNEASPTALTVIGPAPFSSIMLAYGGCTVLSHLDNTYSGGTRMIDAALEPAADSSLGLVPEQPATNIVTSGLALLRAKKNAWPLELHAHRGIEIRGGCLALMGDDGNQAGKTIVRVNGPISGTGTLVLNHWAGEGVNSVIELNGDNSAFEGAYVVHGILRAQEGVGLSRAANLALCDQNNPATKGSGIVEMSGVMDRAPGTGPGQVQWAEANTFFSSLIGSNDPAESGGFAAYGGPLTVNLGGDRRLLTIGQDGFNPTVLRLQTDTATHDLTWENPINLADRTLTIQVAQSSSSKQVFWRGSLSNSGSTVRSLHVRRNGKLILCDGADIGPRINLNMTSPLQCLITNRQTLACELSGTGTLAKWGHGITFTTGTNTLSGTINVYEGTWYANGEHTLAGAYMVSNHATLGGNGLIVPQAGETIQVDGTLMPGAEPGVCGTLTLGSPEAHTTLHLNGTLQAEVALENHDCAVVFGDVTFGEGAAVAVTAQDEEVWQARRGEEIPLLTWSGAQSGIWIQATTLPSGWKVLQKENGLALAYVPTGTMITVQ